MQRLIRVCTIIGVLGSIFSSIAQDTRPAADPALWAPEDTLMFAGVTDLSKLIEGVKRTAGWRMLQTSAGKNVPEQINPVLGHMDALRQRFSDAIGVEPERLENPFGGRLVLYLTETGDAREAAAPAITLIVGVADANLMRDYYDRAADKFVRLADEHESISFASQTIDVYSSSASDAAKPASAADPNSGDPLSMRAGGLRKFFGGLLGELFSGDSLPPKLAMCLTADRFLVAADAELLKQALRRQEQRDTLANLPDYRNLARQFDAPGPLRLFVNLSRLTSVIEREEKEGGRIVASLGLKGMRSLIAHMDYGAAAYDSRVEAMLTLSGERSGLAKILSMKNAPVAPDRSVSSTNSVYARLNVNAAELLGEIERIVRRVSPESADATFSALESMPLPTGETINLRKELFGNLRAPLAFRLALLKPYTPDSPRFLFSLGHRDQPAIARLLETLAGLAPGMVTDRDVRGSVVYDVPLGGVSFAPASDRIILGSGPAVEADLAATSADTPLASDEAFKRLSKLAPSRAWLTFYADGARLYEAALAFAGQRQAIQSAMIGNSGAMAASLVVEAMLGDIDKDKLSDAGALERFHGQGLLTITTTPDGVKLSLLQGVYKR